MSRVMKKEVMVTRNSLKKNYIEPDFVFEVSWEVCNKVGGIYTV